MYSIDLQQISLDEFEEMISTIDLLPGRRILLQDLSAIIDRLKQKGILHLGALQSLLRNKKNYPELAVELFVSPEYLVVLNREINGYISRPIPLSKLDTFSDVELERLEGVGMKSTKDLYEKCFGKTTRQEIAQRLDLPEKSLEDALELADLLRINGVGPVYAKILREIGIRDSAFYSRTESREILERYQKINQERGYTRVNLGLRDIDYCKRFSQKLESEIEW
jgi:predicted flap endonuclease-1-like 5' DNA nuclease